MRRVAAASLSVALSAVMVVSLAGGAGAVGTVGDSSPEGPRVFWTTYGVPESTQDTLEAKYNTTGVIDAFNPANTPVETRIVDNEGQISTVEVFADGSIHVSSVETPTELAPGAIAPRGISQCTVTSGAGWAEYKNCLVEGSDGYRTMTFRASYQKATGAYAKIVSCASPSAGSSIGNMTNPKRTQYRLNSTAQQSALCQYSSVFTSWNGGGAETILLSLYLSTGGVPTVTRT